MDVLKTTNFPLGETNARRIVSPPVGGVSDNTFVKGVGVLVKINTGVAVNVDEGCGVLITSTVLDGMLDIVDWEVQDTTIKPESMKNMNFR